MCRKVPTIDAYVDLHANVSDPMLGLVLQPVPIGACEESEELGVLISISILLDDHTPQFNRTYGSDSPNVFASRLSWVSPRVFRGKSSTGHGSDYDHNLGKQRTPPHYFARVIGTEDY